MRPQPVSRSRGFLYLINLFFGGPFLGIVIMMASMHFYSGWPDDVLPWVGGILIAIPYRDQSKGTMIKVYILGTLAVVLAQLAGRGLAILAAGGAYNSYHLMGSS